MICSSQASATDFVNVRRYDMDSRRTPEAFCVHIKYWQRQPADADWGQSL